jgi:FtsH-binding integral membrane protein
MISTNPQTESSLVDAIKFSRRMGNYLYLPLFLVCGFCALVMYSFFLGEPDSNMSGQRSVFYVFAIAAISGAILWWLSRKPRATLFLAQGVFLVGLWIIWVAWYLGNLAFNFSHFWKRGLGGVEWFVAVALAMGAAAVKCLSLSRSLKNVDDVQMERLLERLKTFSGLSKPGV